MIGRNRGVFSHTCNRKPWWIAALRGPRALLAIAALCGGLLATPAAAQWAASDLFPNPPVPTQAGPHGLEGLAGVLDTAPVERGLGRLRLQLPGGGKVEMARDGFERRAAGDVTWRGSVTDDDGSRVILTVRNGYMAGRILHGLEEYEIRPGPGRSHVIERVDTSIEPDVDYSYYNPDEVNYDVVDPPPIYGNSPDNIQLLAVYTLQARVAAGGTPQMEVRIQSMVDHVNAAFIDSGMVARIALVRAEELAYVESGDVRTDLDWARGYNTPDSSDYSVPNKREFFGADLVTLIVDNDGRCTGAAYVMHTPDRAFAPWAYSVSALSCGAGALAHEIGHNMGFEHNPEDSIRAYGGYYDPIGRLITASYPWSFGHFVDGSFRTIMSYPTQCPSGCPMALRFSNPDLDFLGSPTGIVDERDNAQTGDLTAPIVTDFMDAVVGAVVNRRVAASVEDVEETADGTVVLDSTSLELGSGGLGGVEAVGLRFQTIHIPQGMRIDSAYLEFEAADLGSAATTVTISAEAADNAAPFSATLFDVTGRPATLASAQWDIPAWTAATEKHYSPDISAIIQEVVDRPGWLENNSLVITVGGTGVRTALSHDGGAISAPLLHVEYSRPGLPETVQVPVATFGYSCTGLTCTFTDQSTDSDGIIVQWLWHFGPPLSRGSSERNPTVTFPAEETYRISLRVTDDHGLLGRTEQALTITETSANVAPIATDNYYHTREDKVLIGNILTDGTPDSDLDGDPLTVTANTDPSGGTLALAANGDFTFSPSGTGSQYFLYTISDGNGGSATARVNIEIEPEVAADFRYSCNELACSFADASTSPEGAIVSWYWSFANTAYIDDIYYVPDTSTEQNPSYNFPGAGTYRVSLTATDSNGSVGGVSRDISVTYVSSPPTAAFRYSCAGLTCTFIDESTDPAGPGDITMWDWYIHDSGSWWFESAEQNVTVTFPADGVYTVNLFVMDTYDYDTVSQNITVAAVNSTPVATDNTYTTDQDAAVSGNVLTDGVPDSDADGDPLTVTGNTAPLNGVLTMAANGVFTYTPNAAFSGSDSFVYTIGDGNGGTASATVTVTVNRANTAPVATANAYTTNEDVAVGGNVLTDGTPDSDADGDTLTVTANTNPLGGAVTMAANGAFTYTPAAGFTGTDSFTYTISDGYGGSTTAAVTITVNSVPVATANAYTTDEDVAVSGNVLTDGTPDSDADGDALTVTANTNPPNGTVTVVANGAFTYTPNADFNGSDSFTYTVSDGKGGTATATVTVTVNSVNDAPVGTSDAYSTDEDAAVSGNVLTDGTPDSDADGDTLTVTANTSPLNGAVTVAVTGAFTYTPAADFFGTDSFTYTVSDGNGGNAAAIVTITVNPVNDPPVAAFDYSCVDLTCTFTDLSTDIDDTIEFWIWGYGDGANGGANTHTYADYGWYNVYLTVRDAAGATVQTVQKITLVEPVNTAPVATNNAYTTAEDAAVSGNVLLDGTPDSDADGDALTVTANSNPLSGTVTVAGNGAFTYTPAADFNGSDSFTYTVSDGTTTATAMVTITVTPVNDAPAAAFAFSCDGLNCVFTDGSSDSLDVGGSIVSWSWSFGDGATSTAQNPAHRYGVDGTYAVALTVTDNDGATATATQTIVTTNTAPVATADAYTTNEDVAVDGNVLLDGVADSDADGDTLTVTANTNPLNGAVTVAANGAFTYTPNADFNGTDSLTYTVSDGIATATATVTITVAPVNDAPVATDNAYTNIEDAAVTGNALTDGTPDSDADGDVLTVTANTSPLNGTVTVWADGVFTYTPNPDFNGSDSFGYTVSDGNGGTAAATVTVTLTPVNDAPVGNADAYTTDEDTAVSGNVLLDGTPDSDVDGDTLTARIGGNDNNGWASIWPSGDFTYSPSPNFNGSGRFSYYVSDGNGASDYVVVTITVNPVNDAPVATDNSYTTSEDVSVSGNVLLNGTPDSDIEGDALTVTANTNPLNGTVTMPANGAFTYTPNADFNGSDSFSYTITDGNGGTATGAVSITVNPVNDAPVAAFSHSCAGLNCVFTDDSTDIEGAISSWSWSFGDGAVSTAQNPAYSYAADGTYTVTLTVTDGEGATATATQTLTVANTPPVATDNAYTTDEDVAVSGNFMTDGVPDSDPDGDPITVLDISVPVSFGTVTGGADGNFTYTPPPNFSGTDSFRYSIIDGISGGSTGTVTITVNPVNDAPVAAFTHDCLGRGCAFSNGSKDVDGPIVAWSWNFGDGALSTVSSPTHSYAVDGIYTVTLTATDDLGATDTVSKAVTVANTVPVATADAYTTAEDSAVSGNVLTDGVADSDADGDALTVTANTNPLNGIVSVAATGAFTYTPNPDFNGSDSFGYTISDGNGGTATATVGITVNSVNDGPVAGFSFICTDLDCGFTDASTDIDGTIAAWSWDFGDGAISTAQSPTHGYAAVDATYTVTLTVTDNQGATDTTAQSVTVVNPFPPDAPSGLIGASTTTGKGANAIMAVTLNWTDNAINEEVFLIERCEVQGKNAKETCSFAPVAEVGADVTAYAESVPGNTSYRYRVKARNRNGESGYSNEAGIPNSQT